jgi:hypothetical protein
MRAGNKRGLPVRALFLGNVAADTYNGIRDELPAEFDCSTSSPTRRTLARAVERGRRRHPGQQSLARRLSGGPAGPAGAVGGDRGRSVRSGGAAARRGGVQRVRPRNRDRRIHRHGVAGAASPAVRDCRRVPRAHGSWRTSWVESGAPHGEVRGSTSGIVGYGRVGREVARRAAPFGARILAANRTPREPDPGVERIFHKLADLDAMLPECDTVALCTALGPGDDRADRRAQAGTDEADRVPDQYRARPSHRRGRAVRGAARRAGSVARRSTCGGSIRPLRRADPARLAPPVPRAADRDRDAAQFRVDAAAWCGAAGTRSPKTSAASRAARALINHVTTI